MHPKQILACSALALPLALWAGPVGAVKIGTVSQPIIVGNEVDVKLQQTLGLVTVNGGCSGTLLNPRWVLTAAHCLTTDGTVRGPWRPNASITATWTGQTATVTRAVRWSDRGLDVAIGFLSRDLHKGVSHQIYYNSTDRPAVGETLVKYGQGISAYATAGPPAKAATADGRYRTATFRVSASSANSYTLPANSAGQVGAGGDSGGPDFKPASGGGAPSLIMGVQSTCSPAGYVTRQPKNWTWSTGISACQSVPLTGLHSEISSAMNGSFELWYLKARHSGKCLHQHRGVQTNGGDITQWDCINQPNVQVRRARINTPKDEVIVLEFAHSNKCVHVQGASNANGAKITQWDCVDQPNVKWRVESAGGSFVYLRNLASGKCLHQHQGVRDNGGWITQWDCINQPNVQWEFVRVK